MTKLVLVGMLVMGLLGLASCSNNNAAVDEAVKARTELFAAMIGAVEKDPTSTGIDDARKVFDSRKAAVKAKWDAARNLKLSEKEHSELVSANNSDFESLLAFQRKHPLSADDRAKFVQLFMDDFKAEFPT